MYDSGISAEDFINSISSEADIAFPVDRLSWYRWINAVEQFVYTEIFRQYTSEVIDSSSISDDTIRFSDDITPPHGCAVPDFDDIIKVYADDTELARSGVISGIVFPDKPLYYADYAGGICLSVPFLCSEITVVYRIRPCLKSADTSFNINLPIEFMDMLAARLRAEAYKVSDDDGASAKWMSDYNTQLETLKVWAAMRSERYGE